MGIAQSTGILLTLATLLEHARPVLAGEDFNGDEVGTLFGFLGAASALIFSCTPPISLPLCVLCSRLRSVLQTALNEPVST